MSEIQRLSVSDLENIKKELKEERGYLESSDLRKPHKIRTQPKIFDLTSRIAPGKPGVGR